MNCYYFFWLDIPQLNEEIKQLKKLREYYESQLKIFGLDLSELDDKTQALLNEYVELQESINLFDLRSSNLKCFYYEKKKEHIENEMLVKILKDEIEKQESEFEKDQAECALLKKFIETTNKRLVSQSAMENEKLNVESNMRILNEKLCGVKTSQYFNIDEIIRKVEELAARNKQKVK
uniref:Uncharacterized protein n=1 Tax=Glossina brevipalpis TaxID=37001 RepID=A0A1A9WB90_9MUSC